MNIKSKTLKHSKRFKNKKIVTISCVYMKNWTKTPFSKLVRGMKILGCSNKGLKGKVFLLFRCNFLQVFFVLIFERVKLKKQKNTPSDMTKHKKEILERINNNSRKQRKNQTSSRAGCEGFEKVLEEAFGFGHLIMKKNWETLRILF